MARKATGAKRGNAAEPISSEEKIARLLGILATKDMENRIDQVTLLRGVGFDVADVASLLGISENHVMVAAHAGRKRRGNKNGKRQKK